MPTKLPKDERQRSSSIDRTTPATKQKNMSGAAADEISAEQMKDILTRARQTVKPIINRRGGERVRERRNPQLQNGMNLN